MGDANPIRTLGDYSKPSHEGYKNTIELPEGNNMALLEDLAFYDNESWNDPRDFAKPVKAISLPQDAPSTSDCHSIKLKNQVQCLMEAHLALMQPTQVNKITSSYTRLSKFEVDFKKQQSKMTNKIDTVLKAITDRITRALPSDTVKIPKLNVNSTTLVLSTRSYPMEDPQCLSQIYSSINAVTICPKQPNKPQNDECKGEDREERSNPENIDTILPLPHDPSISFIMEKGFVAALAVLITGASQSRQHGMSEPGRRSLTD
nr:MAK10-like protein [Tanacetum cinerariifolium]